MILASSILTPSLWTPRTAESRHGAWWRRARKFGASIAAFAGHLKYGAGGSLLYGPTGHLVWSCVTIVPCTECPSTPGSIAVSLTTNSLAQVVVGGGSCVGALGATDAAFNPTDIGTEFDFTLVNNIATASGAADPCIWRGAIFFPDNRWYYNGIGGGSILGFVIAASVSVFDVTGTLFRSSNFSIAQIVGASYGAAIMFLSNLTETVANCSDAWSTNNAGETCSSFANASATWTPL